MIRLRENWAGCGGVLGNSISMCGMLRLLASRASPISSWPHETRVSFEFLRASVCVCALGWVECMLKWKVVNWTFFLLLPSPPIPTPASCFCWHRFCISVGNLYFVCVQHFLQLLLRLLFHFSFHFHFTAVHGIWIPEFGRGSGIWLWLGAHLIFIALQIKVEPHKTGEIIYSNKY